MTIHRDTSMEYPIPPENIKNKDDKKDHDNETKKMSIVSNDQSLILPPILVWEKHHED